MHNLPPRRVLTEQAEKFKASLRRPANRDDELLTSARALFKMLIDPAREEIKDARTLVVIPDGILFETPFEALLAAEPVPGGAWSRQPFLAQQHDIVYAPSASIFLALRERGTRRYSKELVAFGAPDYAAFAPTSPGGRLQFSPLPHARNEVAAAAQAVRTGSKTVYVGRDANEAACKSRLARGSQRVLHFAAHGVIDASDPIYSCIALCPDAEKTEDGLFHTLEILSSPCNVGLVVASACGTARGKVGRGEGIIGLSRAFLGAGAGGVVASLWAVSDESTTELMRIFYGGLYGERLPAAQALNRARMKLLSSDKYSHPYYWSPFVLIGSERTPW